MPLVNQNNAIINQIPRLIEVSPQQIKLNGALIAKGELGRRVQALLKAEDDMVLIRPQEDANLQRIMNIFAILRNANITHIALVE